MRTECHSYFYLRSGLLEIFPIGFLNLPILFQEIAECSMHMLKCNHFRRLLTDNTTCRRVLRQNNLISIIIWVHSFVQKLPNQTPSKCSSILCETIDAWIHNIHERISCADAIPLIFLRFPEFCKHQWLLQDCSWVFPVTCHPPLHECHLHGIVLSC